MKKKKSKILTYLAVLAAVTGCYGGMNSSLIGSAGSRDLIMQNVEALTESNEDGILRDRQDACLKSGGIWNMAGICIETGFQTVTCTVSGEITAFGMTIKGSYSKGNSYIIPWAHYRCIESQGNCCHMQGLYSGSTQLA